jgi:hypothetical protein
MTKPRPHMRKGRSDVFGVTSSPPQWRLASPLPSLNPTPHPDENCEIVFDTGRLTFTTSRPSGPTIRTKINLSPLSFARIEDHAVLSRTQTSTVPPPRASLKQVLRIPASERKEEPARSETSRIDATCRSQMRPTETPKIKVGRHQLPLPPPARSRGEYTATPRSRPAVKNAGEAAPSVFLSNRSLALSYLAR